ncbi:efflux transporter outer membrane subunit [Chitinasiproducens palmae]
MVAALALAGCVNYSGIHSDKTIASPDTLSSTETLPAQGGAWPDEQWAAQFGDPQLQALIDEALADSPSIADAQARLARAAAYSQGARGRLAPRVEARYALTRELLSSNALYPEPYGGQWYTENNASIGATWDLDLWGRNRASLRQAISEEKASAAEAQAVRESISHSVARVYNELAHEYAQYDLIAKEIQRRKEIGEMTRARVGAGLDTQVEVRTSETNVASSDTALAEVEGRMAATRLRLAALLGKGPDRGNTIARPTLLARPAVALPDALPANLVSRRADLVAARWRVDAASQGVEAKKADFYPNLNLSAAFGFDAFGFGRFLQFGSRQANVGPALNLPIFDAGALRAELRGRYADYDAAVANYNKTLIDALSEIATQVAGIRSTEQQRERAQRAFDAAAEAYRLAVIRYRAGLSTQLQVLNADLNQLNEQQRLVDLNAIRVDQQFALIQALGGGFADRHGDGDGDGDSDSATQGAAATATTSATAVPARDGAASAPPAGAATRPPA